MANVSRMNLFGRWVGLTRETSAVAESTGRGYRLFSKRGFVGSALYLHATEGSETIVDIQGLTTVTVGSTATAALQTRGINQLAAAASTLYTLAAPPGAGVRCMITSVSTPTRQVLAAVSIVRGVASSGGGDAGIIAASSDHRTMTFTGIGNVIELVGLSTAAWLAVSVAGFSSASTPITSAA